MTITINQNSQPIAVMQMQGPRGEKGDKGDPGNGGSLVSLTADVVNNNAVANTLQDVTGLSFGVIGDTRYRFRVVCVYTSAATGTGSRWTINGPTATFLAYTSCYTLTATTQTVNHLTAYQLPAASNATSIAAGSIAIIEGVLVPAVSGTVQVQFASEIANSAITCKAGSHLIWEVV